MAGLVGASQVWKCSRFLRLWSQGEGCSQSVCMHEILMHFLAGNRMERRCRWAVAECLWIHWTHWIRWVTVLSGLIVGLKSELFDWISRRQYCWERLDMFSSVFVYLSPSRLPFFFLLLYLRVVIYSVFFFFFFFLPFVLYLIGWLVDWLIGWLTSIMVFLLI